MRISDWSSDVCSSDLNGGEFQYHTPALQNGRWPANQQSQDQRDRQRGRVAIASPPPCRSASRANRERPQSAPAPRHQASRGPPQGLPPRSDERRVGQECAVRVVLGGRRLIKKKKKNNNT